MRASQGGTLDNRSVEAGSETNAALDALLDSTLTKAVRK